VVWVVNAMVGHANDLVDVQVGAIMVQLRVVVEKRGEMNAVGVGHFVASVIWLDLIYLLAVLALYPQAQPLSRHEIRTLRVDLRVRNDELIEGNVLGMTYRVTNITSLDGIVTRARMSENGRERRRQDQGNEGRKEHLSRVGW
jgi:hypothetical protein